MFYINFVTAYFFYKIGSSSSANPTDEMVEVLDDSEPAEADASSSQEIMQPIMQSETQIESEDNDLESVIDQLLDR